MLVDSTGMVDLLNKQLKNGYTLRAFYHSHPSNVLIPSNIGGKYGDIPIAQKMTEISNQSITFVYMDLRVENMSHLVPTQK